MQMATSAEREKTVGPQSLQLLYPPLETVIAANHTREEERNPS